MTRGVSAQLPVCNNLARSPKSFGGFVVKVGPFHQPCLVNVVVMAMIQDCREIIGWTTRIVKNVMIAKVCSRHGDESIIVGYAVSPYTHPNLCCILKQLCRQGQIFCSRCASNIIKGTRFGHDGMIRVCNLCLEKLAKVEDDDDDDDRRSVMSTAASFPAHQFGVDAFLAHHPQSPFAASQLFGRTDEPFNLFSIAETKRQISGSDDGAVASWPVTPGHSDEGSSGWEPVHQNPAPFRRGLSIDEKDGVNISSAYSQGGSPTRLGSKTPIDFPSTAPSGTAGGPVSSIEFPVGSPDHGWDSPRPGSRVRSRFNSFHDFDISTPFIRSRVQSRLDVVASEPGWRHRRESTA